MNTDVVKLGEITSITKLAGFEFTKYFNYNQTGEIIALRALNLRNGKLDLTDIHRIDKSISDKLPRSKLYKGDILFTYTGNGYGDCALVDEDDKYHLAPNICKITSNQEKVDYTFLFYTIRSKSFYGQVSGFIGGSGQPTIPMERIRKLKIFLPKMQVQQKIANILSRYDEAIENNNKRIKLLEQMAQNLYKEWFVRFRFPGYENCEFENGIPVGWNVEKLGNVANISTGKCNREDAEDDGIYPLFDRSQEIKLSNDWIKDCEAIIVPGEGTSFIPRYFVGKFNLHQICYCVEPRTDKTGKFLFYTLMLNRRYFLSVATGATVPSLRYNNFAKMKFVMPELGVCQKFDDYITKYFLQIDNLKIANKNLAKQRDLLLPRLMSGKLEVR